MVVGILLKKNRRVKSFWMNYRSAKPIQEENA